MRTKEFSQGSTSLIMKSPTTVMSNYLKWWRTGNVPLSKTDIEPTTGCD